MHGSTNTMSMLLAVDNDTLRPHESVMPRLRRVADTVLRYLAAGQAEAAVRFMRGQHLPPIALGFVATCLVRRGVGEKDIEAVLLH